MSAALALDGVVKEYPGGVTALRAVSIEIAAALKRGIEVIPVLVGGAKMPSQRELPESLQLLSRRQALELSDVHFTRDVGDLIEALKKPAGMRTTQPFKWIKRPLVLLGHKNNILV